MIPTCFGDSPKSQKTIAEKEHWDSPTLGRVRLSGLGKDQKIQLKHVPCWDASAALTSNQLGLRLRSELECHFPLFHCYSFKTCRLPRIYNGPLERILTCLHNILPISSAGHACLATLLLVQRWTSSGPPARNLH